MNDYQIEHRQDGYWVVGKGCDFGPWATKAEAAECRSRLRAYDRAEAKGPKALRRFVTSEK